MPLEIHLMELPNEQQNFWRLTTLVRTRIKILRASSAFLSAWRSCCAQVAGGLWCGLTKRRSSTATSSLITFWAHQQMNGRLDAPLPRVDSRRNGLRIGASR